MTSVYSSPTPPQTVLYLPIWIRVTYTILSGILAISLPFFLIAGIHLLSSFVAGGFWNNWLILPVAYVLVILIMTSLLAFRIYGHTKTVLVLSDEGVVFDSFWEKMIVPWDNIERIATIPIGGVASEAFLLRTAVPLFYRWGTFPFLRMKPVHIPISGFGRSYGDTSLAQAIQHYAPERLKTVR